MNHNSFIAFLGRFLVGYNMNVNRNFEYHTNFLSIGIEIKSLSPLTISKNERKCFDFLILKCPDLVLSSQVLMKLCNYEEIWVNRGARRIIQYNQRNNKTYVQWSCKSHDPKQSS